MTLASWLISVCFSLEAIVDYMMITGSSSAMARLYLEDDLDVQWPRSMIDQRRRARARTGSNLDSS